MHAAAEKLLANMRESGRVHRDQIQRALELAGVREPEAERVRVVTELLRRGWRTEDSLAYFPPRKKALPKSQRPPPPMGLFTDEVLNRKGERARFAVVCTPDAPQGKLE